MKKSWEKLIKQQRNGMTQKEIMITIILMTKLMQTNSFKLSGKIVLMLVLEFPTQRLLVTIFPLEIGKNIIHFPHKYYHLLKIGK